jgi:Domain of unknown function (DUF4276)
MRLHILVEGESEARFLRGWLKRFLPGHACRVYPHQGKGKLAAEAGRRPVAGREGLLDQLPAKLRAFGKTLDPQTDRVLVLVDADEEDCRLLKSRLLRCLKSIKPAPTTLFRIAIEELEAFYLGDRTALRAAFPRAKLSKLKTYTQDSVCGTAELFQSVVGSVRQDKVEWADRMAPRLGLAFQGSQANESLSFRQLCFGLKRLAGDVD